MGDAEATGRVAAEIVPPELAVRAMRDSGYKNTAYALAELIDNAVQAGASNVEVICEEERRMVSQRERRRISRIAVLDDGCGMDEDVLRKALQFGNGTHLDDRSGIGRFGMGLPNASISQCRRVTVYAWLNGPRNALMTYLDLDEIDRGETRLVPQPRAEPAPREWLDRAAGPAGRSGTLVVWEGFDEHRLTWKSARPTLEHTEALVGRIYRKKIHDGSVGIRLCAYEGAARLVDKPARINDPLYLMASSSTPEPFASKPMFQRWGERDQTFDWDVDGRKHTVVVRASWALQETVPADGRNRGDWPYGKHAARNVGVSIVRAGRELELDASWANPSATEERWWGLEVEFPPALDEVFGVTNNKQAARTFASMAHFDWEAERQDGESYGDFVRRLKAEGDSRALLLDVARYVRDQIGNMRRLLELQTKGSRPGARRHLDQGTVEDRASTKFKGRAAGGHAAPGDGAPLDDDNAPKVVADLVGKGYDDAVANDIVDAARLRGRNVIFVDAASEAHSFFGVDAKPGLTQVVLNTDHPAHALLVRALDDTTEGATERELAARIANASDTLRMLLAAWARYEIEDVPNRARIRDVRQDWGRMARDFLTEG